MLRTADNGLKKLCNLRVLRGSYLWVYRTKVTKVLCGHEMVVDGVMRKVAPDFLRSWVYYFKVHGSLNFLSEMAVVTQKRAQVEVPRREARQSSVQLFPSRGMVLLAIFALDNASSSANVRTLLMSFWRDLKLLPFPVPAACASAS